MKYLYNQLERTKMIEDFFKNDPKPILTGKILDIENDVPENYDVYYMPMFFFVHNWKNGRHFIETQTEIINSNFNINELDPVKDNHLIEEMLYKSKEEKNLVTKTNLEKFSQQEPIIATKTGIIIDGNRRFMLLKKIWREKKLPLNEQKIKVLILKKDYSDKELNMLETKIQFRKEERLDYDPINKKIKIFNMYEDLLSSKGLINKIEKIKVNINSEILDEISKNTGESKSEIKKYLQIINFVKWFLNSKKAPQKYLSLFLNKDEQLKNLFNSVRIINESKKKHSEIRLWFDDDEIIEYRFIDASMSQIVNKVKAVGSFREIMASKKNLSILKYKDIFTEWYEKTIEIVGENLFNLEDLDLTKRDELEKLNKQILRKIDDKDEEYFKNIKIENNINNSLEYINNSQVESAINFIYKRLEYFESIQDLSDFNKNKLKEISKVINKILKNQEV